MWIGRITQGGARRHGPAIVVAGLVALVSVTPALAQDDAGTGTDPAALAAEAVRPGWALHASEAPAFSIQLPAGWVVDPAPEGLLAATGPAGESLVVRLDGSAPGEPFDLYATRVEGMLEAELDEPVPTVFRTASSGPIARLDLPDGEGGDRTSRFLLTPCADGARTLEISGTAPEPAPDGSPDGWDEIAASLSPCSADAAPELVLDPAVQQLAAGYFAFATGFNAKVNRAIDRLNRGRTFADFRRDARRVGALFAEGRKQIGDLPWTPETLPLSEPLAAAYADQEALFKRKLGKVTTNRQIGAADREGQRIAERVSAAGRAIRLAIGLPTLPQ